MTSAYGKAFTVNGKPAQYQRAISSSMYCQTYGRVTSRFRPNPPPYRNFSILEKEEVDLALDDELTAVPTIDQKITVVDSQTINEQDGGIRVAEIDQ